MLRGGSGYQDFIEARNLQPECAVPFAILKEALLGLPMA